MAGCLDKIGKTTTHLNDKPMPPINASTNKTSRAQVPAIARKVQYDGKTVLNFGCGRFPHLLSSYALQKGARRVVNYDPNLDTQALTSIPKQSGVFTLTNFNAITATSPDVIILANVLNVLNTRLLVHGVLRQVEQLASERTEIFISIYEGDKSGKATVTRDGYQLNRRTEDYLPIIGKLIPTHSFKRKGSDIIGLPRLSGINCKI